MILRRLLLIIAIRHGQGQKEALAKLQKLTLLVTMLIVEPEQQLTDHITFIVCCENVRWINRNSRW